LIGRAIGSLKKVARYVRQIMENARGEIF
jgi:hypothetical protein